MYTAESGLGMPVIYTVTNFKEVPPSLPLYLALAGHWGFSSERNRLSALMKLKV